MSNPIFYAANMSAAVFTMSLAENASFSLSNLHTNVPSQLWKSSASTNAQTLNIDLGLAKECDFLALGAHNFTSMTTVKLQYATTDDGNFTDPIDALTLNGAAAAPIPLTFTLATKRYWRILFTDCNSVIPECGLLFLGSKLSMPFNYNMDAELGNKQFGTTSKESLSGILRTSRQIAGRQRMEITFTLIDDATVTLWQTMMDIIQGRLNPFFFKDDRDVIHILHFEEDYVPAKGKRANANDLVRLKMCHQSTG
jgi:hypothetical protein